MIKEKVQKVKALELIKDWALWPRYEANDLDQTNIRRMKEAINAGETLPPVIVDEKSYRIVDGFHRVSAVISLFGEDAEIDAILRRYKNDGEMFLDAALVNTRHGLPLSPKDKVHVILTAKRMKIPIAKVAAALGMTKEVANGLLERRTATTDKGETIPLSAGAMSLAGKKLTKAQEKFARTANGILPIVNARLLMNALRASSCPLTEKEVEVLIELRSEIDKALAKLSKAA